jgi:hypothetical protein
MYRNDSVASAEFRATAARSLRQRSMWLRGTANLFPTWARQSVFGAWAIRRRLFEIAEELPEIADALDANFLGYTRFRPRWCRCCRARAFAMAIMFSVLLAVFVPVAYQLGLEAGRAEGIAHVGKNFKPGLQALLVWARPKPGEAWHSYLIRSVTETTEGSRRMFYELLIDGSPTCMVDSNGKEIPGRHCAVTDQAPTSRHAK